MKIYLIRHGQTTSDVEDRYGGDYDDHLTPLGEKQAEELAQKLRDKGIEIIFSSNRIRAQETSKILKKTLKVEVKTIDDLRERNLYGILTGMIKANALKRYPKLVERLKNTDDTIDGAEDKDAFVKRVVAALKSISKTNYKNVAVITHGGVIRRIYAELLGVKKESHEIKIADCAFAKLEATGDKFSLMTSDGIEILDTPDIYTLKK